MHKFWTSYSKAILALGFSFGLMLLFKWLGVLVYDTNDDTIMAAISYGYYGIPQAGLVYIHPWLGALLAALQRAVPGLSWYLLMEMGILSISMAVLVWLYLEQTHGGQTVLGLYALAALVATETYLLYAGRGLRERVDGALVLTVAVILLLCTRQAERKLLEPRVCGILAAAVILSQTPSLFARKDAAMERYIGAAHIQAACRELSEDKQTLYYFRTDELPPDRLPGRQGDFGYYSNIAVLGGWLTESPYVKQRDQAFGVRNPFRDMVDAENIRLVSNDPEPVLAYIRAHYAENAQLVQVGQARGEYSIWRIQTVQ